MKITSFASTILQIVCAVSCAGFLQSQTLAINLSGDILTVSWAGKTDRIYALQEAQSLGAPNWANVYGPSVGSSCRITNAGLQGFYRLVETPSIFHWPEGAVVEQEITPRSAMNPTNRFYLDIALWKTMFHLQSHSTAFNFSTLEREAAPETWNTIKPDSDHWGTLRTYLNGQYGRAPSHLHIRLTEDRLEWLANTVRDVDPTNRLTFLFIDGCNASSNLIESLGLPVGVTTRADLKREGLRPRMVFYWEGADFSGGMSQEMCVFTRFFYEALWQDNIWGDPCFTIEKQLEIVRQRYPEIMTHLRVAGSYVGVRVDEILLSDLPEPPQIATPLWTFPD